MRRASLVSPRCRPAGGAGTRDAPRGAWDRFEIIKALGVEAPTLLDGQAKHAV